MRLSTTRQSVKAADNLFDNTPHLFVPGLEDDSKRALPELFALVVCLHDDSRRTRPERRAAKLLLLSVQARTLEARPSSIPSHQQRCLNHAASRACTVRLPARSQSQHPAPQPRNASRSAPGIISSARGAFKAWPHHGRCHAASTLPPPRGGRPGGALLPSHSPTALCATATAIARCHRAVRTAAMAPAVASSVYI